MLPSLLAPGVTIKFVHALDNDTIEVTKRRLVSIIFWKLKKMCLFVSVAISAEAGGRKYKRNADKIPRSCYAVLVARKGLYFSCA